MLIIRVEAPLLYFNAGHVRDMVRRHIGTAVEPVRLVILDLSTSPEVDVTAGLMLAALQQELAALGIQLRAVEAHASVRDLLRAGGEKVHLGELSRTLSLDDVVESFLAERSDIRPLAIG